MATAYANSIPAPELLEADGRFDRDGYDRRCKEYRAATEADLRRAGYNHRLTGRIIRFPVADGYAQYMLATPTRWVHLDEGDGWNADPALIRGMRAVDVLARIEQQDNIAKLFAH